MIAPFSLVDILTIILKGLTVDICMEVRFVRTETRAFSPRTTSWSTVTALRLKFVSCLADVENDILFLYLGDSKENYHQVQFRQSFH